MEIANHLIAKIHEIRIGWLQLFHQSPLQIGNAFLDELQHHLGIHVLDTNSIIPGSHLGSSVLAHIGLHIFIDNLIQTIEKLVSGLVLGEGMCLPVVELDLLSHVEKKIYIVGTHRGFLP